MPQKRVIFFLWCFLVLVLARTPALAGTVTYQYDQNGRLTSIQKDDGQTITYAYDRNYNLTSQTTTTNESPSPGGSGRGFGGCFLANLEPSPDPGPKHQREGTAGPASLFLIGGFLVAALALFSSRHRKKKKSSSGSTVHLRMIAVFFLSLALIPALASPLQADTSRGLKKEQGPKEGTTLKDGDPISMGGGEFRESWTFLNLDGPIPLNFTLIYAPDLKNKCPYTDGQWPFPPSTHFTTFINNTILRLVEFRDKTQTGTPTYVNILLGDDVLVFTDDGADHFTPEGPIRYQLIKKNNYYYLMDPSTDLVHIFRSRVLDWDLPTQYVERCGEAVSIINRNGVAVRLEYNADNNPTAITDDLGRTLTLTYNADKYLYSVTDNRGRTVSFTYESVPTLTGAATILASFTDPTDQITSFEFFQTSVNDSNLIRSIVLPLGNSHIDQTWIENPKAVYAISTQKDAFDRQRSYEYGLDGDDNMVVTVTKPDGTTIAYNHLDERYPISQTDETGASLQLSYNARSQMETMTAKTGAAMSVTYHDPSGQPAVVTDVKGGTLTFDYGAQTQAFTNPLNNDQVSFTFYPLEKIVYQDGTTQEFTHDARGNVLTASNGSHVQSFTHNELGLVLTGTNELGGVTEYTYNDDGTMASSRTSDTGTTTYDHDDFGRLSQATEPDGSIFKWEYDPMDRLLKTTDPKGHSTTYTYDANGNLTRIEDAQGHAAAFTYDAMDQRTSRTDRQGNTTTYAYLDGLIRSLTDAAGIILEFGYDARDWLNSETSAGQTWKTEHDSEGSVVKNIYPSQNTFTYTNDAMGLATSVTNPLGQTNTVERDALGRIAKATDPLSRSTSYVYDALGLPTQVTLPDGSSASYTWNGLSGMNTATDLNGQTWTFDYTPMGRLKSMTDPNGQAWNYTYDQRGRLARVNYPDGGSMAQTYDAVGNITQSQFSGGLNLAFTYDELDRLATTSHLGLTRDHDGRVTATVQDGTTFGAEYDAAGKLSKVTYANGALTVTYTYDPATGLLTRVTDSLTGALVLFTYDLDRQLTGIKRSNGLDVVYTYDQAGRVTRLQDGSILDLQFTLNEAGQVVRTDVSTTFSEPDSADKPSNQTLTYDPASQINSAGYAYDARGRLVQSPGNDFAWSGESRLARINDTVLSYNGLGHLIGRQQGSANTVFFHNYGISSLALVAEQNGTTGQFQRYYVLTPGGHLLYMIDAAHGNQPVFYHFDHLGSTLALTGPGGEVTDTYGYAPYGQLLWHTGSSEQPFTFLGQGGGRQEGSEGTLYQLGVRFYDALTARFLSREPIWPIVKDPRLVNPYQYALADPVNFRDVTGREPDELWPETKREWEEKKREWAREWKRMNEARDKKWGKILQEALEKAWEKAEKERKWLRELEMEGGTNIPSLVIVEEGDWEDLPLYNNTGLAKEYWREVSAGQLKSGNKAKGVWVFNKNEWLFFPGGKIHNQGETTVTVEVPYQERFLAFTFKDVGDFGEIK